jgi:hypothetical protein
MRIFTRGQPFHLMGIPIANPQSGIESTPNIACEGYLGVGDPSPQECTPRNPTDAFKHKIGIKEQFISKFLLSPVPGKKNDRIERTTLHPLFP